jgi:hypothetical protein
MKRPTAKSRTLTVSMQSTSRTSAPVVIGQPATVVLVDRVAVVRGAAVVDVVAVDGAVVAAVVVLVADPAADASSR